MKKIIHLGNTRGVADHGWLHSKHTFSFADYYNPERMHFGVLRVINDDIVEAGMGFGTHPHNNMEIISIPLEGSLAHKDSMGNSSVITSGEVQIMSAGTGITHSEFNHSKTDLVNFLQIWVLPKELGIKPRYGQKKFDLSRNKFNLVVTPDKNSEEAVWINQDAYFYLAKTDENNTLEYTLNNKNHGLYIFLIDGEIEISDEKLSKRDAIGISDLENISIKSLKNSYILLMEVPLEL
ncbi:MAG: pirin family protein [Candidatus Sericytochromatia bacterium]